MKRAAIVSAALSLPLAAVGVLVSGCHDSSNDSTMPALAVSIDPADFGEGTVDHLTLTAKGVANPVAFTWRQTAGPLVPLMTKSAHEATALVHELEVAVDAELEFELKLDHGYMTRRQTARAVVRAVDATPALGEKVQVGGASSAAAAFSASGRTWILYGVGNRLESLELTDAQRGPPSEFERGDPLTSGMGIKVPPGHPRPAAEAAPDRPEVHGSRGQAPPSFEQGLAATTQTEPRGDPSCYWAPPWADPTHGPPVHLSPQIKVPHPVGPVHVDAVIRDVEVVPFGSRAFALLALGTDGIAVVDLSAPNGMQVVRTLTVSHLQRSVAWALPTGEITYDNEVASDHAPIVALESDGETLWIGNEGYGIQRTPLAYLIGDGAPVLDQDGTLAIEHDVFTLRFAGEEPWGGPQDLQLVGNRLFAALGVAGIGVFDARTLMGVGAYNLYKDVTVTEDWFVAREPALEVQPLGLDPLTGLPTPAQASFEIRHVWTGAAPAPAPWTELATSGKHYYDAKAIDVVDYGDRATAYVAYGLFGLVALDVTRYDTAHHPQTFLYPTFLGYVPAVPGPGPKAIVGPPATALLLQDDADELTRAGVVDVAVHEGVVWYADYHGGLVALGGAERPRGLWRGAERFYDNDDPTLGEGMMGDHQPPFEAVTTFDMSGYDPGDPGRLPAWMDAFPCLAVTGALDGPAAGLALLPGFDGGPEGVPDVAQLAGPEGLVLYDVSRSDQQPHHAELNVVARRPTTDELGAAADGTPNWQASLGASQSLTTTAEHLYVADGPHGVLAWRIVDAGGFPADELHLVANTLPGSQVGLGPGGALYPAHHACGLTVDAATEKLYSLCSDKGLRRMLVDAVEDGGASVGNPHLLEVHADDVFAHDPRKATVPDDLMNEAYGVALYGDFALVADGRTGLVAYDLSADPTIGGDFLVGALGDIGVAMSVALWTDDVRGRAFALVAAGPEGIAVVDVTVPAAMSLVRTVQPSDPSVLGNAPLIGRTVDVIVDEDRVWFSHDPAGVLAYSVTDLVASGPTQPLGVFRLQAQSEWQGMPGHPRGLAVERIGDKTTLVAAYDQAGAVLIDWSVATSPTLLRVLPSAGSCRDVAIANGRVYVADFDGGMVAFK